MPKDLRIRTEGDSFLIPKELVPFFHMLVGQFSQLGAFTPGALSKDVLNLMIESGWRPPKIVPADEPDTEQPH